MATRKDTNIQLPQLDVRNIMLTIVGDSPLVVHNWSEKAKTAMLNKQMNKASTGREARYPAAEYARSLYWLNPAMPADIDNMPEEEIHLAVAKAQFGFPTRAFKAAAIDAGYQQKILDKKTTARGAFHIDGDFVLIEGTPEPREDMVKIGMGTAEVRFRAEFKIWQVKLHIVYNSRAMSAEQIVSLFNVGGFANGIGEWRPSRDGDYGRFHVETSIDSQI